MAEIWIGKNLANDPWATTTDDISEYYHVQSTGWGGTDKAKTIPSVNYPVGTPARIFVQLPMVIDRSDLTGSRPIKVIDTTIGSTMTRVATAPTGNEYRIPPASSIRRDIIEVSSTKAGNVLDFDYYGEGSVFNANEYNTFRQYFAKTSITANLTISDTDYLGYIEVAHTSTTAKVTVTLPTVADNTERIIRIQNTGGGLTQIDGEGAETISLFENALTEIYLLMEDDYIELVSNGSEWKVKHCYISLITQWINNADWSDRHIFSAFDYDNKSAAVDLTGQHFQIADGGALQKAVILFDSGGVADTGTMYVYNITDRTDSLGVWTNNQTCTCGSGGYTFDVNEASGSSKNQDANFYHGFGLSLIYFKILILISTDGTEANARQVFITDQTVGLGYEIQGSDTDQVILQSGVGGMCIWDATGTGIAIDTEDYYYNIKWYITY